MDILTAIGLERWRLRPTSKVTEVAQVSTPETADAASTGLDAVAPQPPLKPANTSASEPVLMPVESNSAPEAPVLDPLARLDLPALEDWIGSQLNCPGCGEGRSIIGEGRTQSKWLFLIDAPNSAALAESALLSGRQRQLFENILRALQQSPDSVYLSSVFKCSANDELSMDARCNTILHRQVELLKPSVVVCFGEFVAQSFLQSNSPLPDLRGNTHSCLHGAAQAVVTHDLAQLLRHPQLKAEAWQDLQLALQLIEA